MAVREIEIEKLVPADYNPRMELRPGMPEYENLRASIEEYGNVEPIVWNERTGHVVGGHQRLAVLLEIGGRKTLPCSVVDLSLEEEKVLNVALNKIRGQWDYDKLEALLQEIDSELAQSSGFNEGELAVMLADNSDLDDGLFFGDGFGDDDWWNEDELPELGLSYAVSLIFDGRESAEAWLEKEGIEAKIKANSNTLMLRIEDQ